MTLGEIAYRSFTNHVGPATVGDAVSAYEKLPATVRVAWEEAAKNVETAVKLAARLEKKAAKP